ncbi:uncharacterized protein LOC107042883 [Diachasma alloeum]|uniref:uncharacterized protein LOC107042883 n=1 Tax=Diachasma alloeum TaxID=454923 RepID=UPI0007381B27|nr:uncharacterized protein LOC107042883 [Diachasma alloeum]
MGKDVELLNGVSKLFTESLLEEVLAKKWGEKDVKVTGWDFGEASAKGDSYLSEVDRVTIEGNVKGKTTQLKVVVKSLPGNLGRRETYRSTVFFRNEILFYTQIVPEFKKFLASKKQQHLLLVPDCLAYVLDGENDFIVLEDVSVYGFGPASRQSTLSLEECQIILKAMARFHGVSFAHKDQYEKEFHKIADQLEETYFSEKWKDWYERFQGLIVTIAKDAISVEYPGTHQQKKFCDLDGKELWKKSVELCSRSKTPTSVVNQGDAWAPNFLIRVTPNGENETLLLDFQLARCASPITDLSFFIYTCTDQKMRDKNFNFLMQFYHEEISKTISVLGSNADKVYPWESFLKEVKEQFVHGLGFCLESIPLSMLDDTEAFDLDVIKGDKAVNIADVWTLKPIKEAAKRRRLADAIVDAIDRGFL